MRHDRSARSNLRLSRLAPAAGLAATLLLAGCSEDSADQALDQASITLASLDVGVGSQIPPKESAKRFNEVVTAMQPLASGGESHAGDAAVLLAMAQRGLAIQDAAAAAELERRALNMLPKTRAHLRAWINHSTAADAEGEYNPAPEIAQIDADVRARQQEIAEAEAEKAEIQSRIDALLAEVQSRVTEATALRDEAGQLTLRIAGVSATEGLALAEQIRSLTRRADALEFEARDLKSQADHLGLDVTAAGLEINRLRTQVELLGQSRVAVEARGRAAQQAAADSRGYAQEAADSVVAMLESDDGLVAVRAEIDAASEQTISKLTAAARSARGGTTARRTSAQLAIGQIQQSLGDAEWARGMGLDAYAGLMTELATAEPALANAAQYAQRAVDATEASTEARRAAFEAYRAAVSAYESTGARGEAGDLLQQATRKLRTVAGTVGDGVADADALNEIQDAIEAGAPADSPANTRARTSTPLAGDPVAELRAAIAEAVDTARSGDLDGALDFLYPVSDRDAEILNLLRGVARAQAQLDRATETAFGESFSAWTANNPNAGAMGGMGDLSGGLDIDPDSLDIRVSGDEAVALTGDPNEPEVAFRRVDGRWRQVLDMEAQMAADPQAAAMAPMLDGMFTAIAKALSDVAASVESGDITSNEAAAQSVGERVMSAMMGGG